MCGSSSWRGLVPRLQELLGLFQLIPFSLGTAAFCMASPGAPGFSRFSMPWSPPRTELGSQPRTDFHYLVLDQFLKQVRSVV